MLAAVMTVMVLTELTVSLVQICYLKILTKWFSSPRLETRTKESNMYASAAGVKPERAMKVKVVGSLW